MVAVPGGGAPAEMNTSTIHSYQTLRSSVLRHIVTRSSEASGTVSGTCEIVVLVSGIALCGGGWNVVVVVTWNGMMEGGDGSAA